MSLQVLFFFGPDVFASSDDIYLSKQHLGHSKDNTVEVLIFGPSTIYLPFPKLKSFDQKKIKKFYYSSLFSTMYSYLGEWVQSLQEQKLHLYLSL